MNPSQIIGIWEGKTKPDKLIPVPDEILRIYLNHFPSLFSFEWHKNSWSKALEEIAKKKGIEDIFTMLELFYAGRLRDERAIREILKETGLYIPKARGLYLAGKGEFWTIYPKTLIEALRTQGLQFRYKVNPANLLFFDFAVNMMKEVPKELVVPTSDFIYSVKRGFPVYATTLDFFQPDTTDLLKNKPQLLKGRELPVEIYTHTKQAQMNLSSFTQTLSELPTQPVEASKVVENITQKIEDIQPQQLQQPQQPNPKIPPKTISNSSSLLKRWGKIALILGAGSGLLYILSKRKKAQTLEVTTDTEGGEDDDRIGFLPVLSPDVFSGQAKALENEYEKLKKEYLDRIQKIKQLALVSKLTLASQNVNISLSELIAIELQTMNNPERKADYIRGLYNSKKMGVKVKHPDELLAYSKIEKDNTLESFIDDYIKMQKEELDLYENELQNLRRDISYLHRQSLLAQAWTIKETNRRLWQTHITNVKEKQNKILNMLLREVESK